MHRIDVEWFEEAKVTDVVSLMRTYGAMPAPRLYAFGPDNPVEPSFPFLGSIACRAYFSHQDARDALAELGRAATLIAAERLVLLWEHRELSYALTGRMREPQALVTADVQRDSHILTVRHFTEQVLPPSFRGIHPQFQMPHAVWHNGQLPPGITDAVRLWRLRVPLPGTGDVSAATAVLQRSGYDVDWTDQG